MSWMRESVRKEKKASLEYLSMRRQSWVELDTVTILGNVTCDLTGERTERGERGRERERGDQPAA